MNEANSRVDICDVLIDKNLPVCQRAEEYEKQVKDPYHFRCGKVMVNLAFSSDGPSLEKVLKNYLKRISS